MRMRTIFLSFLFLAGCSFQLGASTHGEKQRATFEYGACLFGCAVDQPMMSGTEERIVVGATSIPALTVTSSMPGVLEVSSATKDCCTTDGTCRSVDASFACSQGEAATTLTVDVVTIAPGTTKLVLTKQDDGTPFDDVALSVAAPATLTVSCGDAALASGATCAVTWIERDANGTSLRATTGVTLETSDAKIVQFREGLFSNETASVTASQGFLGTTMIAHAAGDAKVTATAPNGGVTDTMAVHVVP